MQVVMACPQLGFQPVGAIVEQLAAPEDVAEQVRVEDQQGRRLGACLVFPIELATGDSRDVGIARVALLAIDEVAHVLAHQQAAEPGLQLRRQPALAAGLGPGKHQYFHAVAGSSSRRQVRQPCTASRVKSP
ncbi:hypothetical protein D3C80_1519340 [compost metagenome]